MERIAVVSAILDDPKNTQQQFNKIVSEISFMIRGRIGLPFDKEKIATVCLVVIGKMDDINTLTFKLGQISNVSVKTAISNKEVSLL